MTDTALVIGFFVYGAGCFVLGWVSARRTLDDNSDRGWLPTERRRWRP